jgi:hypothetical protein
MKLAEALMQRADCRRRMEQLRERLLTNARVLANEVPSENPAILLEQYDRTVSEAGRLMQWINRTNSSARFDQDRTLTDALAERDVLRWRHSTYRLLAERATVNTDSFSHAEIPIRSALDVGRLQREADGIAALHRTIDAKIQKLNWEIDLND